MDILDVIQERHSVRAYHKRPVDAEALRDLLTEVERINKESGLNFQILINEPEAFSGALPKYGSFKNVTNYFVCAGKKSPELDEKVGYYGEKFVLRAQELGLNTCWVGLSYSKRKMPVKVAEDEKVVAVISFGYGITQGIEHKSKPYDKLTDVPKEDAPEWFKRGMIGAMLAPTAMNQQRFFVTSKDGKVDIERTSKIMPYTKVDLGIVKYEFEAAAGEGFPGFYQKF